MAFAYLLPGFVLLVLGAEVLVRGAARLAALLGITPLVIGLTVVAFGTSAPETAVSIQAAFTGKGDLALGNVLGSNVANVLLILGATALVTPLVVSRQLIRLDVPLMVVASLLVYGLAWDGALGRAEGALLFASVVAYTGFQVVTSRRQGAAAAAAAPTPGGAPDEFEREFGPRGGGGRVALTSGGLVLLGLALLVGGSQLLVEGAVMLARALGLSELVIGLTVVAVGTSLPELATSLLAASRGERDIAVGNVVGSNIFNLLCVLGLGALASPAPIGVAASALAFDFPVMCAVALACLPIFFTGYGIDRWEGALFLGYYAAYTTYLVLASTGKPFAQVFGHAMLGYVVPLTAITLAVIAARAWRRQT